MTLQDPSCMGSFKKNKETTSFTKINGGKGLPMSDKFFTAFYTMLHFQIILN